MNLDSSSDTSESEPPKPNSAAVTSPPIWLGSIPNTDMTMPASTSTARLVMRNKAIRLNM